MRLDERWIWLGERDVADACGVAVFRAYPGAWWLVTGAEMIGPLTDRTILRALRVACTPTIDGCELGPSKLGVVELGPKRPLRKGHKWQAVDEGELPPSVTTYDRDALAPVSGCCTTFEAMPTVAWGRAEGWEGLLDEAPARGGRLVASWNAHPAGSLVFAHGADLAAGVVIVDVPGA